MEIRWRGEREGGEAAALHMGRRRGGDGGELRGESRNGGSSLRGIDLETEASGEEEIRFVGGTRWTHVERRRQTLRRARAPG